MIYLTDTNAWISYLRRNNVGLVQRFRQVDPADRRLCSVVLGELLYGVLMIAATALANGLTLVTHNTPEFRRVPGLSLEDWQ